MDWLRFVLLPLGGLVCGWLGRMAYGAIRRSSFEQKTGLLLQDAKKEAKQLKKETVLEAKNQILKERQDFEKELRRSRSDLQRNERRLQQKEDALDKKLSKAEERQRKHDELKSSLEKREEKLSVLERERFLELEKIAGITADEAKRQIVEGLESEAVSEAHSLVVKIEGDARANAEKKANAVVLDVIQRICTEVSSETSVATVSLPSDEMKGRIIGREGRNVRALETLTGVDVIIDDTPEAVVISCFDPVRKAVAKIALERLIADGRIHPTRIEEVVGRVNKEVGVKVMEEGERAVFEIGIHNLRQEGVRALGRLHFRTSYGQNVLNHSLEVAKIAGMISAEMGIDTQICVRAALLHDIGKGIEGSAESGHAEIGAELAGRMGENPRVVKAIAMHHSDVEISEPECVVVKIADAISAARPGARRESFDSYIKRLEDLESIASSFGGVEKVFAIQAGRELRIMVNYEKIDDAAARLLARDIARRIETELKYPGIIKVTIIRESRVTEFAS